MVVRTLLLSLLVAGLLTGCRTYVGYDPIKKIESISHRENAVIEQSRYGVSCQWDWNQTVLTFGTFSTISFQQETREWETGKMEYFMAGGEEQQQNSAGKLLAYVILWPLIVLDDTLHLTSPWHLRECGAWLYVPAYIPPISWFAAPVLRPPYASCFQENPIMEKEEVNYASPRLKTIRITPIREECLLPDDTLSAVELRYDGKTIVKNLDSSGQLRFPLMELEPEGVFPPRMMEFQIYHRQRNETWQVKIFSLCSPELLRDWNLVADNRSDFYSRFFALFRLKHALGEEAYRNLTDQLIQQKDLSLPSYPAGSAEIHLIARHP